MNSSRSRSVCRPGSSAQSPPPPFVNAHGGVESGYPAVDATQWFGIIAPADTPKPVIDRLNREILRVMQQPETLERFFANGANVRTSTPQKFAQLIRNDLAKWQKVVKASGLLPE